MGKSKKLNRDHAKKTQPPMVEDGVIAHQLEALLTPAITNQENYDRSIKTQGQNPEFALDGSWGVDFTVYHGYRFAYGEMSQGLQN